MNIYKKRRQEILSKNKNAIIIVFGNDYAQRSNDTDYPFRQDSNFYYLTGFSEPKSVLVLTGKDQKEHLFLRDSDPLDEMWNGTRLGVAKAKSEFLVDATYCISSFETEISKLLIGHAELYMDSVHHSAKASKVQNTIAKLATMRKIKEGYPTKTSLLLDLLGKMRAKKDSSEIETMKKACEISSKTHNAIMQITKPGLNEHDVHFFINYYFAKHGSPHNAYGNIVAGGNNANILHYHNNNQELKNGDLILVDAGCEYGLYASDITRTYPVNGKFTPAQKEIYELVLKVQKACILKAKPGVTITELQDFTIRELSLGLIELGVLKASISEIIEKNLYKEFYPHGVSHWLGMDVHDPCPYYNDDRSDTKLEPGMIITVEPGLYFSSNNKNVPEKFKGIGVRIEDDILITTNGNENLTKAAIKEISEIEAMCKTKFTESVI